MAASSGILREWHRTPPPFMFLVAAILALALAITYSHLGTRIVATIPLWVLVLVQAFRLPLELAMHDMYERGIMPVQMSYSGLNFDIITGATAIPVVFLDRDPTSRAGRRGGLESSRSWHSWSTWSRSRSWRRRAFATSVTAI